MLPNFITKIRPALVVGDIGLNFFALGCFDWV